MFVLPDEGHSTHVWKVLGGLGDFYEKSPKKPRPLLTTAHCGGQCPHPVLAFHAVRTQIPMALCVYCSKISHGGSQGLIAVLGACEAS